MNSPEQRPATPYALTFDVDYPDRPLDRVTSALRIFTVIPIAIVLTALGAVSASGSSGDDLLGFAASGASLLFLAPLLMIVSRKKYPRWWFDWNRELLRFTNRVHAYGALLNDKYPSTDEQQYVKLELDYPDAHGGLNRWLPLVKWFLAIPHYIVLFFLYIGALFAVIAAWFVTRRHSWPPQAARHVSPSHQGAPAGPPRRDCPSIARRSLSRTRGS